MPVNRFSFTAQELLPYIDWSYFFFAWGIRPADSGSEAALQLKDEAVALLLSGGGECRVNALFRLCRAKSVGDDILLDDVCLLPLLRRQTAVEGSPNLCLSDFVSPHGDHVGLFAVAVERSFENSRGDDPYHNLLVQTLCDRLAEAAASLLHKMVRTDSALWGYSPDENLTVDRLNREEYQGIRPAVGYPSLPDQSVIFLIDDMLGLDGIGIELTSSGAMMPHASVCGLMIAHPAARYFAVGRIDNVQLADYAARRGLPVERLRVFLARNIAAESLS